VRANEERKKQTVGDRANALARVLEEEPYSRQTIAAEKAGSSRSSGRWGPPMRTAIDAALPEGHAGEHLTAHPCC
jgi:hypothetical protein